MRTTQVILPEAITKAITEIRERAIKAAASLRVEALRLHTWIAQHGGEKLCLQFDTPSVTIGFTAFTRDIEGDKEKVMLEMEAFVIKTLKERGETP